MRVALTKHRLAVLIVAALLPLGAAGPMQAQSARRPSRLPYLQQQNALLQQQVAVQSAVQQTIALLESAKAAGPQVGLTTGVPPKVSALTPINLQQQQIALQIAVQQTTALLQVSFRQNSALSQLALQQLNTLQTALQQTMTLQGALPTDTGQLTPFQMRVLYQEQGSLQGLLSSLPPAVPRKLSPR